MPDQKPYAESGVALADSPALLLRIEQDGSNSMAGCMEPEDIPTLLRTIASNIEAQLTAGGEASLTESVTEYGIDDGDGRPEKLPTGTTRKRADDRLADLRRVWDELPLTLVQRTVTTSPWGPATAVNAGDPR